MKSFKFAWTSMPIGTTYIIIFSSLFYISIWDILMLVSSSAIFAYLVCPLNFGVKWEKNHTWHSFKWLVEFDGTWMKWKGFQLTYRLLKSNVILCLKWTSCWVSCRYGSAPLFVFLLVGWSLEILAGANFLSTGIPIIGEHFFPSEWLLFEL